MEASKDGSAAIAVMIASWKYDGPLVAGSHGLSSMSLIKVGCRFQ